MKTVFMVAEKPSLAQAISKILSNGNVQSRKGFNGACSVHEFTAAFRGEMMKIKMTSVCGHVMGVDFLGKYTSWDKVDPVPFISMMCNISRNIFSIALFGYIYFYETCER